MNLLLIVAGIGLLGFMHAAVGVYSGIRLLCGLFEHGWKRALSLATLASLLFFAAIAAWVSMLFLLPRTSAPIAVLNMPAWILLGGYLLVELAIPRGRASWGLAWEGVGLAVPLCSLFAYVYYTPLSHIFGPIRTW